jgi:CRP/FNR family transcriptional regulator
VPHTGSTKKTKTAHGPLWFLKRSPFFKQLPGETLDKIARRLAVREVTKGSPVGLMDAPADRAYVLLRGTVKVCRIEPSDGKELILYVVTPGVPFGALPFIDETGDDTVAIALQKTLLGEIHRDDLARLLSGSAGRDAVIALVQENAELIRKRMAEVTYGDVETRIARLLLRLCEDHGRKKPCGYQISLPLTQQDIGNFVAATREMASLTLNEFRRRGWIAVHNRKICVHDVKALSRIAE